MPKPPSLILGALPSASRAFREIRDGAPLLVLPVERLDFIPRYAKEIASLGQMKGQLDTALHDAAMLFEHELEFRLLGG